MEDVLISVLSCTNTTYDQKNHKGSGNLDNIREQNRASATFLNIITHANYPNK